MRRTLGFGELQQLARSGPAQKKQQGAEQIEELS
jgi:hypothetical protein